MLAVYLTPMLIRPLDFIQHCHKYLIGLVTYFLMMPVFITCMTVYSWCNLHDISWGNRPAVADTGQLASHALKQKAMLENY
jgi:cellulose synthase/poly-beta-1,6-N-acetylglucosamine synthase-like glycosyltransferase